MPKTRPNRISGTARRRVGLPARRFCCPEKGVCFESTGSYSFRPRLLRRRRGVHGAGNLAEHPTRRGAGYRYCVGRHAALAAGYRPCIRTRSADAAGETAGGLAERSQIGATPCRPKQRSPAGIRGVPRSCQSGSGTVRSISRCTGQTRRSRA